MADGVINEISHGISDNVNILLNLNANHDVCDHAREITIGDIITTNLRHLGIPEDDIIRNQIGGNQIGGNCDPNTVESAKLVIYVLSTVLCYIIFESIKQLSKIYNSVPVKKGKKKEKGKGKGKGTPKNTSTAVAAVAVQPNSFIANANEYLGKFSPFNLNNYEDSMNKWFAFSSLQLLWCLGRNKIISVIKNILTNPVVLTKKICNLIHTIYVQYDRSILEITQAMFNSVILQMDNIKPGHFYIIAADKYTATGVLDVLMQGLLDIVCELLKVSYSEDIINHQINITGYGNNTGVGIQKTKKGVRMQKTKKGVRMQKTKRRKY